MSEHQWCLVYLLLAVTLTGIGQLLFRMHYLRAGYAHLTAALGTFLAVPLLNYLALRILPLGTVYMSAAVTHILVTIMSRVVLHERISGRKALSILLITLGILTFNL